MVKVSDRDIVRHKYLSTEVQGTRTGLECGLVSVLWIVIVLGYKYRVLECGVNVRFSVRDIDSFGIQLP